MIRRIDLSGDTESLFQCWNASAHFDPLPLEVFKDKLNDDGYREGFGWLDDDGNEVRGFIVGVARTVDQKTVGQKTVDQEKLGTVKLLAVRPSCRRRGLGSALLARLLDAFEHEGTRRIRVAESAPNYLTPGLDVRYTPALHLFENHGFKIIGEAYNLEASLPDEGFPADEISGLTVRRAMSSDAAALKRFVSSEWEAWVPEVQRSMSRDPVAVHLALRLDRRNDRQNEQIVAFSAYEGNNAGLGTFGPMGTAQDFRGRGLGENLLKRCLTDLAKMGYERVIIPWVAPIGFYSKTVGATISRVFTRLELER